MKMVAPSLSKEALLTWLLNHCEKLIGGFVLLIAFWLAWGGIRTLQSKSATADLRPEKISSRAVAALEHIDAAQQPPKEKLLEPRGLGDSIGAWDAPVEKEPHKLVLSRPLFDELARRTKPEVFPLKQLRAVSGIAVMAVPAGGGEAGGRPSRPGRQPPPAPGIDPAMGDFTGQMGIDQVDPSAAVPPARITPYVIVTGLIPYAEQYGDYLERFGTASFREPRLDSPLWSDFLIERADVTSGGEPKWERIDLKKVTQAMQKEWANVQPDSLLPDFFLSPTEQPGLGEVLYAWPLPQLAMESWGPEAVHPWALTEWQRLLAEQAALAPGDGSNPLQPGGPTGLPFGGGPMGIPFGGEGQFGPGFGSLPGGSSGEFGGSAEFGMSPLSDPGGMPQPGTSLIEYKMFRFVDTAVQEGRAYRYRVRVSVWNPNYRVPPQHLADADLAKAMKLPSDYSNETAPVKVPGALAVLSRTLPEEPKRGTAEVLVLLPNEKTGNYALHSALVEPGNVVSVERPVPGADERVVGRPGRGKQEPATETVPVGLVLDFMGQQAVPPPGPAAPAGRRSRKPTAPAEPFAIVMLGDDGQLKIANPIDSEPRYRLYSNTLPADKRGLPATMMSPDGFSPEGSPEGLFPGFPGSR